MNLTDNLVAILIAGIKATQSPAANPLVTAAYTQVKSLLRDRYPTVDLQAVERRPTSQPKQQSLAEDLAELGAATDPHFLAVLSLLAQLLLEDKSVSTSIGVDLAIIQATALKIREVQSTGAGVRIHNAVLVENVEIAGVQAGATDQEPNGDEDIDIELTGVTAGGDIIINSVADPHAQHLAILRADYLIWLFRRADTIFLSHVNPQSQVAPRVSLKAVYTAQLTHSLVITKEAERKPGRGRVNRGQVAQERRLTAVESINAHQHLVLLGAPGSGKSSFLKFVALCMAGEFLHHSEANLSLLATTLPTTDAPTSAEPATARQEQPWTHGPLLPVYIPLRELVAAGVFAEHEEGSVDGFFAYINQELKQASQEAYAPYLRQELMQQGGLLLLDGLDEVTDGANQRRQIRQAIEEFSALYPKCRIVLSSRPYAYQDPTWQLPSFAEAILAPFDLWQIERFIDAYYAHLLRVQGAIERNNSQAQANAFKAEVKKDPYLRELAATPLLLTLMVSLFAWRGGALPDNNDELYAQGVDLLLNEWERPKLEPTDDGNAQPLALSVHEWLQAPQQNIRQALEELAFQAHAQQATLDAAARIPEGEVVEALLRAAGRDARPGRLTEYIQNRAGLLIDHGDGTHSFPHRTIQEYLAACYLTRTNFPKHLTSLVRADPQRWREVLVLAGGKAARGAPFAVWALIDRLCPLSYTTPTAATATDWWMALLAGRVLVETELYRADPLDLSEVQSLTTVKAWLLALISTGQLPAPERARAGADLGILGDPRRGVALNDVGIPEIDWITIPAGPFRMGEPAFTCPLITAPYRISRYPITIAQYQSFVSTGGYTDSSYWSAAGWQWRQATAHEGPELYPSLRYSPNQPQTGICWYEAMAFCQWLAARTGDAITLPSEAQWERAARHTDGRVYPWGDDFAATHCNLRDSGIAQPTTVGLFVTGNAACGAADLAGNVWEWCITAWRNSYAHAAASVDERGAPTERRVLRGGSWANEQHLVRCAHRHRNYPDHRGPNVGFRVITVDR